MRTPELAAVFGVARAHMPHPTTWSRVLGFGSTAHAIDHARAPLLVPPLAAIPYRASQHCAFDGKPLRGPIPADASYGVHLLPLYNVTRTAGLHQVLVGTNANELTSAPQVVSACQRSGVLGTGVAMFTHRSLRTQIVEAGGDYCWIVKADQPALYDD